jgi:ribosomal protein S18 acetylase RimI-like enzyme
VADNFQKALISIYRESPSQVLPNALWKSLPWIEQFETDFKVEAGKVCHLRIWNERQLMVFWQRDRGFQNISIQFPTPLQFALVHQDFLPMINFNSFDDRKSFFRLTHNLNKIPNVSLPDGFRFTIADPLNESQAISDFISGCYDEITLTSETVKTWIKHPVYDPDLWLWLLDGSKDIPVALGIAEFDPIVPEGSLEWIQVSPKYQGKGFGKQIVAELLKRLSNRAEFVTVSGQVENQTRPDLLYRSCGFEGEDIWWVLGVCTQGLILLAK